jgi:hypothetical protein
MRSLGRDLRYPNPPPKLTRLARRSSRGELLTVVAFRLVPLGVLVSRLGAPRSVSAARWASLGVVTILAASLLIPAVVGIRR